MKYSKGEWSIVGLGITYQIYSQGRKNSIAECIYNKGNAQLISAAPELYEALKLVTKFSLIREGCIPIDIIKKIEQALGKAKGD